MVCLSSYLQILIYTVLLMFVAESMGDSEEKILVRFKESLLNATALADWNDESGEKCCTGNISNWQGVLCWNGKLTGLRLEAMGLMGKIDVNTLAQLPSLRSLSVMNNSFSGPMPDIKVIGSLRQLYMSNNHFSGELPDNAFSGMKAVRRIVLANNEFSGRIPMSLTTLPKLVDLQLQNNQFVGQIPDFPQKKLVVNLAMNHLEGPVPEHLSSQSSSSLFGNNLCGKPLEPCKVPPRKRSVPKLTIVLTVVGATALVGIIAASVICCGYRKKLSRYEKSTVENLHKKESTDHHKGDGKRAKNPEHGKSFKKNDNRGRLYFVKDSRKRFELDDLLRAPAEVLGSGSFGSSYKAEISNGLPMVVRRFRQMSSVGREEFHEHMSRIGRLSHPNLLSLVAFYYRKEEKLLINEYVENGSLASHLHGKRSPNQLALDWPRRLTIIKGVARGLAYLYKELPAMSTPHGHLKSSNVLLDRKFNPLLADYALSAVINREHAEQFMVAYKSPEYTQHDRVSRKTDVWSLGILILELLTGKFPANYLRQGKGGNEDLATWVNSVVREEWTGEVFDKEMDAAKNAEGQMLKLLKIGMCCCEWNEERRWDLREAVERIEELNERDSFYGSEEEFYSSQPTTEDEFSLKI